MKEEKLSIFVDALNRFSFTYHYTKTAVPGVLTNIVKSAGRLNYYHPNILIHVTVLMVFSMLKYYAGYFYLFIYYF